MASVVVYQLNDRLQIACPAPTATAEEAAAALVPTGTPYRIVDEADLPQDATYRDAWTANFDDEPCVVSVDSEKQAVIESQLKVAQADSWFAEQIAVGFVSPGGFTLGLTPTDVTLLTGNYVLAKEAAAADLPLPPVIDTDGVVHEIEDIADLTALMLAYGQHRAALSAEYAALKAAASN